ncbi:hydroxyethylthiazole kinase [Alteribacter populi]|uniref:hydroxyethylthiazole kinase n=1 Tax=Alteribacter populi TaxID=2011011 RepID=UPI000BBB0D1C|nr:hydroxyethylthiazole kinase [Alteribacter populi]
MDKKIIALKQKIESESPLIHNMTNVVVTNFTANGLYAIGASPVMSYAKEEVADMAAIAQGLVLNIGTLTPTQVEAMHIAGRSANEHEVSTFLDPVGVGATAYRTKTAKNLLSELEISFIRGNLGEVSNLVDEKIEMKGVDSKKQHDNALLIAQKAARQYRTNVVLTGKTDIITDGAKTYFVHNGTPMLTKVTGTGCLLTSVMSAFVAVGQDPLEAAAGAVSYYAIAAEIAADKVTAQGESFGHFQVHFIDQLADVSQKEIAKRLSIEVWEEK